MPGGGLDQAPWLWPVFAGALGLIVGSFANVCIYRVPLSKSIVRPGSSCPSCGRAIRPWDNIPVLSFLLLRGRCRSCGSSISARYPLVEGANGLLYLALALRFGPSPTALFLMALVTALVVLSAIDLDHQILPDVITLPGLALGLLASLLGISTVGVEGALLGALGGYAAFFAIAWSYRRSRGVEGLGQGDWKMAALLGACLGWKALLLVVLLASVAGTLVGAGLMAFRGRTSQHRLPFGTFLGLAGIAVIFVGDDVLSWYAGLFRG